MGIAVDSCTKGFVVMTRVAEQLTITQILRGQQLTVTVGESVEVGINIKFTLLDAEQLALLTN